MKEVASRNDYCIEQDSDLKPYEWYPKGETKLFEKLPELIRPKKLSELLDISVSTIYDWKYRAKMRNIPKELFVKVNRLLFIRTEVLRNWITPNILL